MGIQRLRAGVLVRESGWNHKDTDGVQMHKTWVCPRGAVQHVKGLHLQTKEAERAAFDACGLCKAVFHVQRLPLHKVCVLVLGHARYV